MARPEWKFGEDLSIARVRGSELGPGLRAGKPAEPNSADDVDLIIIETVGNEKPITLAVRGDLKRFADQIVRAAYGPEARIDTPDRYSWEVYEHETPTLLFISRYGHGHHNLGVDNPGNGMQGIDKVFAIALLEHALGKLLDGEEPRIYRKEQR